MEREITHEPVRGAQAETATEERERCIGQSTSRSKSDNKGSFDAMLTLLYDLCLQMTSTPTVWMCVYHLPSSSLYGVSTFDLHSEVLHIGEFTEVAPIQELKMRIGPSQIVTNANAAEQLYDLLASNDVDPSHPFELITLKRQEFTTEAAIQRLRLVQFEDLASGMTTEEMKTMSKSDHALLLKSVLDFQRPSLLCALGGLIHHLLHTAIFAQLESDRMLAPVIVRSLQPLPTADLLKVDLLTRESLSIFVSESHPSAGGGPRGGGKAKEGYSVFAMVNHTKTPGGARMLREWMENPTKEREVILYRQDHVEYFTMDANSVS